MRYLMVWAGCVWLMFEIVPTKLPQYILPALSATGHSRRLLGVRSLARTGLRRLAGFLRQGVAGLQFAIGLVAFVVMTAIAPQRFGSGLIWPLIAIAGVGAAVGLAGLRAFAGGQEAELRFSAGMGSLDDLRAASDRGCWPHCPGVSLAQSRQCLRRHGLDHERDRRTWTSRRLLLPDMPSPA